MTPKKTRRWMTSVIAEAAKCDTQMPWACGEAPRRDDRAPCRKRDAARPAGGMLRAS
ncbi:MAG: hypothetical protein R3D78_12760 [Paracoccaceae bacterium]